MYKSWSSADRRCSNYIQVINSFIAYEGAAYIRDLPVNPWFTYYTLGLSLINVDIDIYIYVYIYIYDFIVETVLLEYGALFQYKIVVSPV